MGLRQWFNQSPYRTGAFLVVLIGTSIGFAMYVSRSDVVTPPDKLFFTTDDGKTFFGDDARKLAPFDINGKRAVQANVYTVDHSSPFVAYMIKYSPEYQRVKSKLGVNPPPELVRKGTFVKRPGDSEWLLMESPQGKSLVEMLKSPTGAPASQFENVYP